MDVGEKVDKDKLLEEGDEGKEQGEEEEGPRKSLEQERQALAARPVRLSSLLWKRKGGKWTMRRRGCWRSRRCCCS